MFLTEVSKSARIIFILSLVFASVSYSQDNIGYLFRGGNHAVYIGSGYLDGKRIVSDMQITPKDSSNREIHVRLEILTDWKVTESLEFDLLLDTAATASIETINGKSEAIRYYLEGSDLFVDFEKPSSYTYYNQDKESITVWVSHYASVNFPQRLKKYQKVLEIYNEK